MPRTPAHLLRFLVRLQSSATLAAVVALWVGAIAASSAAGQAWRLEEGAYISAKMAPVIVFPRPDDETHEWARHRKTYPGLAYRIPVAVQGGAWAFHYELTQAPQGLRIGDRPDEPDYGVITWDSPTQGSHAVAVKVTDQEGTAVSVNWTLEVTPQKTLFLSPDGDDANPGTLEQPKRSFAGWHLDDTDDATYQGYHVILRGGAYPWAGMGSRNNNIQIHDRKPLVFLAYPGEEPVMDMSGGKFIANRAGGAAGAPDLFIQGITFQNADQDRPNAHIFWLTGGSTQRVTLFENIFRNVGPGERGNDNPSVSFVSDTSNRKSYFAYIGNTYEGLARAANGVSMFDHYYTDYTLFENNHMIDLESRFSGWSKHHDDIVTYRRNTGTFTPRGDGGLLVFNPDTTTPESRVEFCWNYITVNGPIDDRTAAVLLFNYAMRDGGNVWAYRNTIVGRIASRSSDSGGRVRLAERNVIIHPGNGLKNLEDVDNLIGTPGDGIIDDAGKLTGRYRMQYLGTHGWEWPPTRDR